MLAQGLITALAVLAAPTAPASTDASVLHSYTEAYESAEGRPMLVVLNSGSQPAADIDVESLKADPQLADALGDYVVAEIDTTTDHGAQVYELFNSPSLPHVVVINGNRKQVFKESGSMTADELRAAVQGSTVTTVTANRPIASTSIVTAAPIASSVSSTVVSEPVVSSPVVSSPAPVVSTPIYSSSLAPPVPSLVPAAPKGECKACQKYRAYQF